MSHVCIGVIVHLWIRPDHPNSGPAPGAHLGGCAHGHGACSCRAQHGYTAHTTQARHTHQRVWTQTVWHEVAF